MRVLITGASGMVGSAVLLECLASKDISQVVAVSRTPIKMQHEKLHQIIHEDFFDLTSIKPQLVDFDACYFCLGVSAAGMSEQQYHSVTYDLTLNFAKTLVEQNPQMTFCYVTGAGTDSSEQGRVMWARVKGKTENALMALPFKQAFMFRPAFIRPLKGIQSKTKLYNYSLKLFSPFFGLLTRFPRFATTSVQLGQAMVKVTQQGYKTAILESIDINSL